ncbi:hypothetical protein BDZ94DRAFT_1268843 [Collybia nuda]|uniref:Uncharacterized protein n=1 Tax=Collybia nuda TaxID=64659 RepID=A0A9P5Y0R9_9AGAR|nr:hypothetical protein BDZ94DRAFT_1268843 [Collybia nuda]
MMHVKKITKMPKSIVVTFKRQERIIVVVLISFKSIDDFVVIAFQFILEALR